MSPDPMITRLAQPLLALRASLGNHGDVGATVAALTAASHGIEQAAVGGQSPLAELPQVWDGDAGTAAATRVGQLQTAAGQIADRGSRIGPIVSQAASDLNADRRQLDAIIAQFMSLGEMDPQVLHSASGVTAAITVANHALQQSLAVVSHAGATLADATRSLQGLTPPSDQVPARISGGGSDENYDSDGTADGIVDAPPASSGETNSAGAEPLAGGSAGSAVLEPDGQTLDPMRTIGNSFTTAGASAVGEVAGYVIGDLGEVLGDVTSAIGSVIHHAGDAAAKLIDRAVDPKAAAAADAAADGSGDGDGSGAAAPAIGQAPFGPSPAKPIDVHKPLDHGGPAPAEPFGGAPAPQAPVLAAPPAPAVQAPNGGLPQAAPQAPAGQAPGGSIPDNQADGGGTAPLVPLPGGHGPADAPKPHRGQAGVTDAATDQGAPPLADALTA